MRFPEQICAYQSFFILLFFLFSFVSIHANSKILKSSTYPRTNREKPQEVKEKEITSMN